MGNQNNQNSNNTQGDLLSRSVDVKPVGLIYNITGAMVENFVEDYLAKKGVDGIATVKVVLRNERSNNPSVSVYLFVAKNSSGIVSNEKQIPQMLKGKIDKVNVRLSEDFKQILVPLAGQEFEAGKADRGEHYVKLNIFRILGLMFSAVPGRHQLTIPAATSIPGSKDCVISVIKQEMYQKNNSNKDNYSRQVEYLEKRCH